LADKAPADLSFRELTGKAPGEVNERPAQGIRRERGEFGSYLLAISMQVDRADLILSMPPQKEAPELIQIGSYDAAVRALEDLIQSWWTKHPHVVRLALAPTLVRKFEQKIDSLKYLRRWLPTVNFDPERDQDIIWQINRPRRSGIKKDLVINRLARWQVAELRAVEITGPRVAIPRVAYLAQLTLDINTQADHTEAFEASKLPRLMDELTLLSRELITNGDTL
jgi:hypothetical protein